mmetsp:Transcript_2280/g.3278  ORF Transcript_2280/g.3278 Transcript_2280/m.3278 type:complete len:99 (-) Transcript_2280:25-321(-)
MNTQKIEDGIDLKKLENIVRSYEQNNAIGIPNPPTFHKIKTAQWIDKKEKIIECTYQLVESNSPMVMFGNDEIQNTVRVKDYSSVSSVPVTQTLSSFT